MRIGIHDIVKRFGNNEVVSRSSFSIGEGEMFTLLGPSGCGKTTLLRLIAGFYSPDAGEIFFGDKLVNAVPPHERGIGMVFQNYALWPHMTVHENVGYGLGLRKTPSADIRMRVQAVLEKVRLTGLGDRYPGQLSGGQQQRVALARALVLNPKILLLDEPLSNLDAKIRIQVRAEIRKLQKELGITTVYVTHDQEEALTLSDRIAVFNQGRIFQVGAPRELYEKPVNRFVADFIGINNMLEGTVEAVDADFLQISTKLGELRALPNAALRAGERCIVCMRPENLAIGEPAPQRNAFRGRVSFAAYLGNPLRYDVDVGQGLTLKVDDRDPWHHPQRAIGSDAELGCAWTATLAIRAD